MNNVTEKKVIVFDLSWKVTPELYDGITLEHEPRFNICTPVPQDAANAIAKNSKKIVDAAKKEGKIETAVITGGVPMWVSMIFAHEIMHQCTELRYDNGNGFNVCIAKHG